MKVAFDTTTLAFEKKTGTGVYCEELVNAFQNTFTEDQVIHTYRLARALKGKKYFLKLTSNSQRQVLQDPWTVFSGFGYDVFHGLNARLPLLVGTKKIVTIHDLFSIFGNFSEEKFKKDQEQKILSTLGRAHHIIVPATFTKHQLERSLKISPQKITVVGEGVRKVYLHDFDKTKEQKSVQEFLKTKSPFFLFVGTLEKRKNVKGLVKVFNRFRAHSKTDHKLVLVGHGGFGFDEIKSEIENSPFKADILQMGFLSQNELAGLYRACTAFLFLSFEEGFGIPIIEAMACGAPVVSSDTTSLPEVGNGFSFLTDPDDQDMIMSQLEKIVSQSPEVLTRVQQGQVHARTLTWEKVAKDTRAVYQKILNP